MILNINNVRIVIIHSTHATSMPDLKQNGRLARYQTPVRVAITSEF